MEYAQNVGGRARSGAMQSVGATSQPSAPRSGLVYPPFVRLNAQRLRVRFFAAGAAGVAPVLRGLRFLAAARASRAAFTSGV